MNIFEQVHEEHKKIAEGMINAIKGEEYASPYFTYHGPFTSRENVKHGKRGIYIFTVTERIELTHTIIRKYNAAENWNGTLIGAGFKGFPDVLEPGTIFYLGKASGEEDSVYRRLKTHFDGVSDSATNGIRMNMPERKFMVGKLELHVFLLDEKYNNFKRLIIDPVEKELHKRLQPVTGGSQ